MMTKARKQVLLIFGAFVVFLVLLAIFVHPGPLVVLGLLVGVGVGVLAIFTLVYTLIDGEWPWNW
jgi:hypothetical protein